MNKYMTHYVNLVFAHTLNAREEILLAHQRADHIPDQELRAKIETAMAALKSVRDHIKTKCEV